MVKRFIFSLLFLFTISQASILYKNKNICIEDYYYKNRYFYYKQSSNGKWRSTSTKNNNLEYGYVYNDDNETCEYDSTLKELNLTYFDYYFLMGISGVLIGFVVMFGFITGVISFTKD